MTRSDPMDLKTLLTEVDGWSAGERIQLMNELWDRLVDQGHEPQLIDPEKAELDRRLAEDDAAPDDVVSWEEVKAQALTRIGR
jgi:putative addiction module component (TIGR02574 family)